MLTTHKEVIDKIRARYEGVTSLSKVGSNEEENTNCVYDPSTNGVGCFISALLPVQDAKRLEQISNDIHEGGCNIYKLFTSDEAKKILGQHIDLTKISLSFLFNIQLCHDDPGAETVEQALHNLDVYEKSIQ